jgi:hypothetical protein
MECADVKSASGDEIHLCRFNGEVSLFKCNRWGFGYMEPIAAQAVLYELLKE